jgi:GGDEF domain-containing protein
MDKLAFGFWGCYFGTTALMLAGSALAFARSLHRISLNAALSATASSFFVLAFLGGLPIEDEGTQARVLTHIALLVSVFLAYLLFSILGLLVKRRVRVRTRLALGVMTLSAMVVSWALPPRQSLALGMGLACLMGVVALGISLRSVNRGDRLAWTAVSGVFFMLIAMIGLGWIALARGQVPWQVHAVSALSGTAYLVTMVAALWARYSYLIELNQVMALGPSYDPVTRLRSHTETGQMLGDIFRRHRDELPEPEGPDAEDDGTEEGSGDWGGARRHPARSIGVMVVSIGNLYALERLHGPAAANHALFVCAGRLQRSLPASVETGRFSEDGFVLLIRNCSDSGQLIRLAHLLEARLSKPVTLNTVIDPSRRESEQTRWQAEIGIGVQLVSDPAARASGVLARCKGMSRTAMTYASRVAWFDKTSGETVELPELEAG